MTYHLIYRNDRDGNLTVLSSHSTLDEAAKARLCSGDLVVGADYLPVVVDSWLFNWELADPQCYAKRMIALRDSGYYRVGAVIPSTTSTIIQHAK